MDFTEASKSDASRVTKVRACTCAVAPMIASIAWGDRGIQLTTPASGLGFAHSETTLVSSRKFIDRSGASDLSLG